MINNIINYYKKTMSKNELKQITAIKDEDKLLLYLIYSYNCYVLLHNKENISLITNTDALFKDYESEKQFIKEFKNFIKDMVNEYEINENRTETTNIQNQ